MDKKESFMTYVKVFILVITLYSFYSLLGVALTFTGEFNLLNTTSAKVVEINNNKVKVYISYSTDDPEIIEIKKPLLINIKKNSIITIKKDNNSAYYFLNNKTIEYIGESIIELITIQITILIFYFGTMYLLKKLDIGAEKKYEFTYIVLFVIGFIFCTFGVDTSKFELFEIIGVSLIISYPVILKIKELENKKN